MSVMADAAGEYLALRRAVGFKLAETGRLLVDFVAFAQTAGVERVTTRLVMDWAALAASSSGHNRRLTAVRGFARWFQCLDPVSEIPPPGAGPTQTHLHRPYLFTTADITALMAVARDLQPALRAVTAETVIGLLAVTGMRIGEVLRLDVGDVDFDDGALTIWHTKFNKSRQLPLSASTLDALGHYHQLRYHLASRPATNPSFFVSPGGARLDYQRFRCDFVALLDLAGVPSTPWPRRPHIHDLRHSFAVRTVTEWYRDGLDVAALLPRLSTYLGHLGPASTYWYLSASPELLALAADRLEPGDQP